MATPSDSRRYYVTDMGSVIDGDGYILLDETGILDEDAVEEIVRRANVHGELIAALKHLVAEMTGLIGISEAEIRAACGNTNVNVSLRRLDEARIVLAKVSQ